jgi:hypothetical protein
MCAASRAARKPTIHFLSVAHAIPFAAQAVSRHPIMRPLPGKLEGAGLGENRMKKI